MPLDLQIISKKIIPTVEVHLYDSIDSTNNEAKRRAESDRGLHLYATMHQTAGRGRRGHDFYSPPDTGLYMTLALPLRAKPEAVQILTCTAATAVCEAVRELSDKRPLIKWVNDIYLDGKKTAGILTELVTDSKNQPVAVIIGIGLNLKTEHFPEEFAAVAGNLGDIEPNLLCAEIVNRLCGHADALPGKDFLKQYREWNLCIGRVVTYTENGALHTAVAVDIDDGGGLVVEENGVQRVLNSGEISVKPESFSPRSNNRYNPSFIE